MTLFFPFYTNCDQLDSVTRTQSTAVTSQLIKSLSPLMIWIKKRKLGRSFHAIKGVNYFRPTNLRSQKSNEKIMSHRL